MLLPTRLALLLMIAGSANAGSVDDEFGRGALGLTWGVSLTDVQARYPHGLTWETGPTNGRGYAYEVNVIETPFKVGDEAVHVHFYFNKNEKLQEVIIHFDYDHKDDALYRVGEIIGQDYSSKDVGNAITYEWHTKSPVSVDMTIGKSRHYGWARLRIDGSQVARFVEWQRQHSGT